MQSMAKGALAAALSAVLASGCTAHLANPLTTHWEPVHRFPVQTQSIALTPMVEYRVTPVDVSLRNLLSRWAYQGGVVSDFQLDRDWTLHSAVSQLNASTLPEALDQLSRAYSGQGFHVVLRSNRIVTAPDATASAGGAP